MTINCTEYNDCPKYQTRVNNQDDGILKCIFLGCWGVYCKDGLHTSIKFKAIDDNEVDMKTSVVEYGQYRVSEAMKQYSQSIDGGIDAVILAGDNIYADNPDEEQIKQVKTKKDIKKLKNDLFDIERQLYEGFKKCFFDKINTKDFLMGIGNHDIENCNVLNKQINYNNWIMPGLSYNYIYNKNNMIVNFIFIDTNIYDKNYCQGVYPIYARENQREWLGGVLQENVNNWNIVIGHIPFLCNSHKNTSVRFEKELYEDISSLKHLIDVYMCADEHNQQYITLPDMPPQIISGSGGSILDNISLSQDINTYTQLSRTNFGFVALNIDPDFINVDFHNVDANIIPIHFQIPRNNRINRRIIGDEDEDEGEEEAKESAAHY